MCTFYPLAEQYIEEVSGGELVTGELSRLAVERHLQLLQWYEEKGSYFDGNKSREVPLLFDKDSACKALNVFSLLKHTSGSYGGKPFAMLPWQAFVIVSLFGWKVKNEAGEWVRLFRKAYVEVAKKNGKTELAAGLGLIGAFFDGEYGAEVYSAANKFDQARICWRSASTMARFLQQDSPKFANLCTIHSSLNNCNIFSNLQNSFFKPVAGESKTLDGLRPHFSIIDEFHEARDDGILRNLSSGMVNRDQPLLFIITTAGFNINGPCYQYRKVIADILRGHKEDWSTFGIIFTLDEGDDWNDESVWIKANPSIGITPTWEGLRTEHVKAINEGHSAEVNFLTKNLNKWTTVAETWIQDADWMRDASPLEYSELYGRECYAGLDLAKTRDLTALCLLFPPVETEEPYKFLYFFWCPRENAEERARKDGVPYLDWAREGHITMTAGDVTDYDYILEEVVNLGALYHIKGISYDPWNATHFAIKLQEQSPRINIKEFPQTARYFNQPVQWIERTLLQGKINHGGNPVARWMAANVVLGRDVNDNVRINKNKSQEKVDGIVAMAMAVGEFLDQAGKNVNIDYSQIIWT